MRFVVLETGQEAAAHGAGLVKKVLDVKRDAVLMLSAGEGMHRFYEELVRLQQGGALDFSAVTTLNVEEYVGLSATHNKSLNRFMEENLFGQVRINRDFTFLPDGNPGNLDETMAAYDQRLETLGGADIAVLEVGENGSIGFNEPGEVLETGTHVEFLSEETLEAHAKSFGSLGEVPSEGVTLGMDGILRARRIVLLVTGGSKADVADALSDTKVTTLIPATLLKLHPDVVVVLDREAASRMDLHEKARPWPRGMGR